MWIGRLLLALLVVQGSVAFAQSKRRGRRTMKGAKVKKVKIPVPTNHARALRKVRQGSMVRQRQYRRVYFDLRGEFERRRDTLLAQHFKRLAVLDYIADIANAGHDLAFLSRITGVRRSEVDRYNAAMRQLQLVHLSAYQQGTP